MTYDTKNRILHTGVYEKVKLTKLQHKLLVCLSSGNAVSIKEIAEYSHGVFDKYTDYAIRRTIFKLRVKTKKQLKIKTVNKFGYRLESEIYFE